MRRASVTRRVGPGESAVFSWPARALEEGTATVRFRANATGGYGDAVELTLPVHLDVTPETTATGGVVEDTARIEAVYLPEYVITGSGSLELALQASLVGALDEELVHFWPVYRWESNVRIASRIVATVAVKRASASGLTEEQERQTREGHRDARRVRRRYDGGWAWCRSCSRTDLWVTGWVLIALGEARDAGYAVPDYQYNRTTAADHGPREPRDRRHAPGGREPARVPAVRAHERRERGRDGQSPRAGAGRACSARWWRSIART